MGFAATSDTTVAGVALAPDAQNDGNLTLGEILYAGDTQNLTAELVVLSACGAHPGDRELGGLLRAFLDRGARSVIAATGTVDDQSTMELMTRFYDHWLGDMDAPTKAEALRRAQEELRLLPGMRNSERWGAFVIYGAP
jgi:CHAT domain-containing protein